MLIDKLDKYFSCFSMKTYIVGTLRDTSNDYQLYMLSRRNKKSVNNFWLNNGFSEVIVIFCAHLIKN